MDIAALSMGMAQANLSQQVSVALMKNTMDVAKNNAQNMIQMLNNATPAPHPTLGKNFDVSI